MINSKSINGVTITILGSSNAPKFIYNLPDTWTGSDLKKWLKKYQDEINEAKNDLILVLEAKTFISRSKECIFNPDATSSQFNRTGIDYLYYHRASSNGLGWVLICPDEPANNWYTENHLVLQFMRANFKG